MTIGTLTASRPARAVITSLSLVAALLILLGTSRIAAAVGADFVLVSAAPKTVTTAAVAAAAKAATRGVVSSDRKTIAFTGRSVHLVIGTGPDTDMLSYRIGGLRNPTLIVPAGAALRILFVNDDEDMKHNVRFTTDRPPFAPTPDVRRSIGAPELAPRTATALHAEELVLRAPAKPGNYSYLCTVRGHAKGGMYGALTVR